jgi:LmbE family N-acetylglucosaminyl deacetylase
MLKKIFNVIRYSLFPSGPYRFLVRNWSGLDDVNLVGAVISTETFRRTLISQPLPLIPTDSLLVIAPHQDDELIGAGGLCIQARDKGLKLSILFATDGAETGLGKQFAKELTPNEVVELRRTEAKEVCRRLNADYLELGIDNIKLEPTVANLAELARLIIELKPNAVVIPWLLDGSPKHRVVSHMLWLAAQRHKLPNFEVWGYQVNNSPFANSILDISPQIDEKIALLKLYVSQNELLRRYDYQAWGLAAWNARFLPSKSTDKSEKYAELYSTLPQVEFFRLVETFYLKDLERTYLGSSRIAEAMKRLHKQVMSIS